MGELLCDAAMPSAGSWMVCCRPATAVHRYGCLHEHIVEKPTCDLHSPQPGIVGCSQCFEAGHECEMVAELVETLT